MGLFLILHLPILQGRKDSGYSSSLGLTPGEFRRRIKHDPIKIEGALISFDGVPHIREAAAIGVKDSEMGERIVCFIVIDPSVQKEISMVDFTSELRKHVALMYDPTACPDEIYIVEALPKNLAAKILRSHIRHVYNGGALSDLSAIDNVPSLKNISEVIKK